MATLFTVEAVEFDPGFVIFRCGDRDTVGEITIRWPTDFAGPTNLEVVLAQAATDVGALLRACAERADAQAAALLAHASAG